MSRPVVEAFGFPGATVVRNSTELPWDLMLPGMQLLFAGWSSLKALTAGVHVGTAGTLLRTHIARALPVTDKAVMQNNWQEY